MPRWTMCWLAASRVTRRTAQPQCWSGTRNCSAPFDDVRGVFGCGNSARLPDCNRLDTVKEPMSRYNTQELAITLFEEAGDALLLFDPETEELVDANPMAQRLTGIGRSELLRLPV